MAKTARRSTETPASSGSRSRFLAFRSNMEGGNHAET
jgi:hypothetical protein